MANKAEIKKEIKKLQNMYNDLEKLIKEKYGITVKEYFDKSKKGEL